MSESQDVARRLGESLSALLNCGHHVIVQPNPSAEVLQALAAAVEQLLAVHADLKAPPNVDMNAVSTIMSEMRNALANGEAARLPVLCRQLFAALAIPLPPPTTAA